MNKILGMRSAAILACLAWTGAPLTAQVNSQGLNTPRRATDNVAREVRHELVMLPRYTLFDNLQYQVNGTSVTLTGQVVKPILKSDAESAVKSVEGVTQVVNKIEVLPLSPMDNRIRRAEFFKLFNGDSPLVKYGEGAVPPIHIIVANGHVTLEGVVDNPTDKNTATLLAKQVGGVFSVTNNLQVAGQS